METILVSGRPSDRFRGNPELGREFLVVALRLLACWPTARPLCLLYNIESFFRSRSSQFW